jgi:glycine oxidase
MPAQSPPAAEPVWFATLSPAERAELAVGRGEIVHRAPDLLVVGGGIIGLATTFFAAERGLRVQLIEAGGLAGGATGASAGGIWPNDPGPAGAEALQPLAFESRDLWGRLSLRPQFDFDWRVNGFLNVNAERIGPSVAETAARLHEQGNAVQDVDAEQIARLEPNLRPDLKYGLHLPSDAHLHPVKAALSFARAARRLGAGVNPDVEARALTRQGGKIAAVETSVGPIAAKHIVAATGWSAGWLGDAIGPPPPLRPVSGQMIATGPLPPLVRSAVSGEFIILQLRSGEIISGGSLLESDCLTPDDALSERIARAARDLAPALRDVPFIRAWCGIRPGTPDGLPIIDRASAADNLWLASGHFRNGLLLAPATGKHLTDWIATGTTPDVLAPFRSNRFGINLAR